MRRVAELSEKKAAAMLARRALREKARVFRGWRRLHAKKRENRRTTTGKGTTRERGMGGSEASSDRSSNRSSGRSSERSSSRSSVASRASSGSSRGSSGLPSSSSSSPLSCRQRSGGKTTARYSNEDLMFSASPQRHSFSAPTASEAAKAGRANFSACFRTQTEPNARRVRPEGDGVLGSKPTMAPVDVAAKVVREAIVGGRGIQRFYTPEMRALARFEWQRSTHEANNTRVLYGS